ncbi:MAG TPA: glycoside hydrolase family 15 protein [Mycobacteriales bacterium]|nr:glycoside hydrolase family 15 protein [Mycobacteriales bacterium]HVU60224.1 glycoside hydrolase family 15 protein [Mycobacteriales bacterium]
MTRDGDGYAPIESYAAIGDGRSVALVSTDGRIDWWPVPALDAAPTFAALLDPVRGGYIALEPVQPYETTRRYLPDTNVVETTFTTESGEVRITDCLPYGRSGRLAWSELARRIEGVTGEVEMRWEVVPGTQLASAEPWIAERQDALIIRVSEDQLVLRHFDVGTPTCDGHRASATFTAVPGHTALLAVIGTTDAPVFLADRKELDGHFPITERRWQEWASAIDYAGPWEEAVRRSALALRMLQYVPTGAVAAAPTTSLPEVVGGEKNWDYRFMWVRDCAFTIDAFLALRLHDEAQAAVQWMLGALRRTEPSLHVFYRLDGSPSDGTIDLPDVPGYRHSAPVRSGNLAASQQQLGTFGDLFDMIWQYVDDGHCLDPKTARLLTEFADRCCDIWRRKDSGIWELSTERHYTISKIGCWTALDRAVRLHDAGQIPSDHIGRWKYERDAIRAWVDEHCWSPERSCYTGFAGGDGLDAATLLMARTGFDRGERLAGTVAAIRKELCDGPVVRRYSGTDDGGGFIACSFWLVHALVLLGDLEEARMLMDEAVALTNDVGLLAEMMDASTGTMLGNFPQGLSHLALINAACAYSRAAG